MKFPILSFCSIIQTSVTYSHIEDKKTQIKFNELESEFQL